MPRDFDGTDDVLNVDATPISGLPLTLACWFVSDNDTDDKCLMGVGVSGGQAESRIMTGGATTGDPLLAVSATSGANSAAATSSGFTVGTWHHACGVWTNSFTRRAYIDGGSVGSNTDTRTTGTRNRVSIGRTASSEATAFFDGRIAHAAMWNAALNANEVKALASGTSPLRIRPSALRGYWPIFGNSSPEPNYARDGPTYNLDVTGAVRHNSGPPRFQFPFGMTSGWLGAMSASGTTFSRSYSESLGLVDSLSRLSDANRAFADLHGLVDAVARLSDANRAFADLHGLVDAVARLSDANRHYTEFHGLKDGLFREAIFSLLVSEMLGMADLALRYVETKRSYTDLHGLGDTLARICDASREYVDRLGKADSLSRLSDANRRYADLHGLVDAIARLSDASRHYTEFHGIGDAVSHEIVILLMVSEYLGTADAALKLAEARRAFLDAVGILDACARVADSKLLVSESLASGDVLARICDAMRVYAELLGFIDPVFRELLVKAKIDFGDLEEVPRRRADECDTKSLRRRAADCANER